MLASSSIATTARFVGVSNARMKLFAAGDLPPPNVFSLCSSTRSAFGVRSVLVSSAKVNFFGVTRTLESAAVKPVLFDDGAIVSLNMETELSALKAMSGGTGESFRNEGVPMALLSRQASVNGVGDIWLGLRQGGGEAGDGAIGCWSGLGGSVLSVAGGSESSAVK